MMVFRLHTNDDVVFLSARHVVSVKKNGATTGSIIRMVNGDQWAVIHAPEAVQELVGLWTKD